MSNGSPLHVERAQPSIPKLTLRVGTSPISEQPTVDGTDVKEESSSPVRPSYSPVTPTLSHANLPPQERPSQQWIDEPQPLPISLDENPDAIALRATISLLQMQRQQTLKDLRNLDKIKSEALHNPDEFVQDLRNGKLQKPTAEGISFDDESDDEEDARADHIYDNSQQIQPHPKPRFGQLPNAQNVARCPPIEWSKYHIAGESLDRLHELQKEYPGLTEDAVVRGTKPQPHKVTAPYRPFEDRVETKTSSLDRVNYP